MKALFGPLLDVYVKALCGPLLDVYIRAMCGPILNEGNIMHRVQARSHGTVTSLKKGNEMHRV